MKMKKFIVGILFLACFYSYGQEYQITSKEASVEFYFIMKDTRGTISDVEASINIDLNDLTKATVSGKAKVSSMSTDNEGRDEHLMADDMFDVFRFPYISFESSSVEMSSDKNTAIGNLTIRDVTKEVVFKIVTNDDNLTFKTQINSADFGISVRDQYEENAVDVSVTVPLK